MSTLRVNAITDAAGTGSPAFTNSLVGQHEVQVSEGNGHGSSNTKIRRFSAVNKNVGTAITYADSASLGASFTINETGLYVISYSDNSSAGSVVAGISLNSAQLTTSIGSFANADTILGVGLNATNFVSVCSAAAYLTAGDVVRPHTDGTLNSTGYFTIFRIAKVGV